MNNLFSPAKTVNFDMIGQDGNAFVLIATLAAHSESEEGW